MKYLNKRIRAIFLPKNKFLKNFIDKIIVLATSLLWLPLLCVIAIILKLKNPKEPVFFIQNRLGEHGKIFKCFKFRTMMSDQSFMDEFLANNPDEKKYYEKYHKFMHDPRIDSFGAFLRKSSLDELPQLFNVLLGEMSLVGPRPYMVNERHDMKGFLALILEVKPGITGLWQVSGRAATSFRARLRIDLLYIKNWSLWFDFVIILKTFRAVLNSHGAS